MRVSAQEVLEGRAAGMPLLQRGYQSTQAEDVPSLSWTFRRQSTA